MLEENKTVFEKQDGIYSFEQIYPMHQHYGIYPVPSLTFLILYEVKNYKGVTFSGRQGLNKVIKK